MEAMKRILLAAILAATITGLSAQDSLNMNILGRLDYGVLHGTGLSDVWGYVDEFGNEYALVGAQDGTSVVSLANPALPTEIFWEPGSNSTWRDLKTWGDYAYITTEANDGLLIIDLTPLPGGPITNWTYYFGPGGDPWSSAHNLYIDENGICYIFGANRDAGGVIMLDLTIDPMNPVEVGKFENWYCHDGMARNGILYSAHISDGHFAVVDVTNPSSPVLLATQATSMTFAHNIWLSDDEDYVYTTDELSNAFVDSYDISNLSNIQRLDMKNNPHSAGSIPHNTHFINEYIVTSWYRDGTIIHDVTYPYNMVEVAFYDTSPASGDGYNSHWGTYPWLPSGMIISTDISAGLYVFDATYTRACYLEGTVTEFGTGIPLAGANIEIISTTVNETADIAGDYATGTPTAGTYDIAFSNAGYFPDTAYSVTLTNGVLTIQDMALVPMTPFAFTGQVQESWSGTGIPNSHVLIENDDFSFPITTDGSGNFTIPSMFAGDYDVYAGQWGYQTVCLTNQSFSSSSNSIVIQLDSGYYDDFTFDFGWTVSSTASDGIWEMDEPIGTTIGSIESNMELDVQTDCFDQCYMTGNGGGSAGTDDVDDGYTFLTSPTFDLTGYINPYLDFYRWWLNGGGSSPGNDTLVMYLSDGVNPDVELFRFHGVQSDMSMWVQHNYRILDFVPALTSTMSVRMETGDDPALDGHLVEAGLDVFQIYEGPTSIDELQTMQTIHVYPNPSNDEIMIEFDETAWEGIPTLTIVDMSGRIVFEKALQGVGDLITIHPELVPGLYILDIRDGRARSAPVKITRY